ncbi:type II toxin-antitoxin system VapC family toxin [Coraliomargarita parva]|uniref:type II toxin-antitoxin system VapC family toxin n=1 Tax=Coraliomargarita parva TaxID=3014050 RepID=UPI0022B49279|nr:hypothetical protein [Coraliomargarita parva]
MNAPFLDTSILIGGLIDFGPQSESSIEMLDRLAEGSIPKAFTAWHCCLEFYSVTTRLPEEYRLTPELAAELVHKEIFDRMQVVGVQAPSANLLIEAAKQPVSGGRIYDFHIGRVALDAKASVIVTENKKHFLNFLKRGLPVCTAKEYLTGLDSNS